MRTKLVKNSKKMTKFFNKDNAFHTIFVAVQLVLLTLILCDLEFNEWFCFAVVLLAFSHAVFSAKNKKHGLILVLAMAFTLVSDVFLVLIYHNTGSIVDQSIGMTTFSLAQLSYFVYIYLNSSDKKLKLIHCLVRVGACVFLIALTLIVLKDNVNYLAIITMFYFANLLLNAIFSFIIRPKNLALAIGFIFFICCDIFVAALAVEGLFITISEQSILYWFAHPPINFAWLFYTISQTLISLSIYLKKEN